ncbi:hypothetical protein, partial [Streptomyces sp. MK7]|uniref:hypothetical protein n=1 Tax=Streptomyces sp. MK7 TaxID=3067635 RepID=UPI0037D9C42A
SRGPEGEVVLLLLGEAQAEDRGEAVEAGAQVVELLGGEAAVGAGQLQMGGGTAGEASDLGVSAARSPVSISSR